MKIKVCLYHRYSSDNQKASSIEYQREQTTLHCNYNDYEIVKEYNDLAVTGQKEFRSAFQEMYKDATSKNCQFSKIIVFSYNRFSRHPGVGFDYYLAFEDLGIDVISVTEPLPPGPAKYACLGMIFGTGYYEVKNNAVFTHAAMKAKANKGYICGGTPLFGYDADGKHWVINETEAEAVRMIYNMYLNGYSYNKMAEELNKNGYRTKTNKPFKKSCFHSILTQVQYTGLKTWNVRSAKKSTTKRNSSKHKPLGEQSRVENGCPEIIPKEMFENVQQIMKAGRCGKRIASSHHHYMLSGLGILKCKCCGANMTAYTRKAHDKTQRYYGCPNHAKKLCPLTEVRADYIENFISCSISLHAIREEYVTKYNLLLKSDDVNDDIAKKIRGKEKAIDNILVAIQKSSNDLLIKRLELLNNEKNELESKINYKVNFTSSKDDITKIRKSFATTLRVSSDIEVSNFLKSVIEYAEIDTNELHLSLAI